MPSFFYLFVLILTTIVIYRLHVSYYTTAEGLEELGGVLVGDPPRGKGVKSPFLRTKIWENVLAKYGSLQANAIFPKTYIIPTDIQEFLQDETKDKEYIVKTLYSGGRVGVFLYEPAMKRNLYEYAVIQEYIKNPLLINGFKFDTRLFMVVDCSKGVFLYKRGYNVYTENRFDYHSKDRTKKINQAYAGDEHYDIHHLPRTTDDLFTHNVPYDQIIYDIGVKLQNIIMATPEAICPMPRTIYGIDVEILDDYNSKIIEINSRPDTIFDDVPWKTNLTQALKDELGSYDSNLWIQIVHADVLSKKNNK